MKNNDDILCNLCGHSCRLGNDRNIGGLINAGIGGGYDSTAGNGYGALDDLSNYGFSLCEFCCDWLFCKFKIPPKVFSIIEHEIVSWRSAKQSVDEDDWRRMKQEFYEEFEKRNKARNE